MMGFALYHLSGHLEMGGGWGQKDWTVVASTDCSPFVVLNRWKSRQYSLRRNKIEINDLKVYQAMQDFMSHSL